MNARLATACVLGLLAASCHSLKSGKGGIAEANPYESTDNGGYTPGGFYDDAPGGWPAPAGGGYPREGQTFGSHESAVTDRAPSGYAGAYGGGGSEQATVVPFTDDPPVTSPKPTNPPPKVASTSKPSSSASKPPAARQSSGSKTVASTKPRSSTSRTTAGTKGGTVVKAVYHPAGKSGASSSSKKVATVQRVHTVKAGDTLTKMSSRYGISVASLKKRNGLSGDKIVIGQRLTID